MADLTDSQKWLALASLLLSGWLLYLLGPVLTPFLVAALLAYLGDPLADWLETRRLSRSLSVTLVFVAIVLVLLLALLIVVPQLESQISTLIRRVPIYIAWSREQLLPWIEQHLGGQLTLPDLAYFQKLAAEHWQQAGGALAGLLGSVSKSGMALLGWLANLVLIPVLTFYLLRDWDLLTASIRAALPRRIEPTVVKLASESDEVLGAFLRGQMLVMLALGIIYTTGLWLVGLEFALLIGMLAGIVSFVPYLGLILGMLVAGVAAVLQFKGIDMLHWVALVFIAGQLLEGMWLTPRLVGERIGLHPVAVIFAVMAGAQLFGFIGVLLGLPLAAVLAVLIRHAYARYRGSELYGQDGPAD